ncbi:KPN_02809 family neutral zinc metallopeptidase [Amantichitinum ursilacus]|uniref:Putative neutral zinc metallopeptidase n=1 Tax=Amantichitinum ursilacus TaxID=857265 RepID=A0A0N0XHF7_9NEIS|nr:neutral zinc metallopeptidase [Amantichitinum ursilacus]KPC49528.1 putative neutral zinc metallopeptidase [Amantichitinum ursilacus]
MRWDEMRESQNVEDRRAEGGGGGGFGGGGVRLGLGGIAVVVVVGLLFGKSPMEMLALVSNLQNGAPTQQHAPAHRATPPVGSSDNDQTAVKVKKVLGDTEDTWKQIFAASGRSYQPPRLVLFRGGVNSGCGFTGSEVGPFYCPSDQKVYLDLGFFDELKQRFGAPGEFAQAYVVAHEVGHHVQNLLGISDKVHQRMQQLNPTGRNALSVRLELQADCFAGVWGHEAAQRNIITGAEMQQALVAANAIGDDTLQRNAGRSVAPDSFTHGSSAQRQHWFQVGFDSGSVDACNTFVRSRPATGPAAAR